MTEKTQTKPAEKILLDDRHPVLLETPAGDILLTFKNDPNAPVVIAEIRTAKRTVPRHYAFII